MYFPRSFFQLGLAYGIMLAMKSAHDAPFHLHISPIISSTKASTLLVRYEARSFSHLEDNRHFSLRLGPVNNIVATIAPLLGLKTSQIVSISLFGKLRYPRLVAQLHATIPTTLALAPPLPTKKQRGAAAPLAAEFDEYYESIEKWGSFVRVQRVEQGGQAIRYIYGRVNAIVRVECEALCPAGGVLATTVINHILLLDRALVVADDGLSQWQQVLCRDGRHKILKFVQATLPSRVVLLADVVEMMSNCPADMTIDQPDQHLQLPLTQQKRAVKPLFKGSS